MSVAEPPSRPSSSGLQPRPTETDPRGGASTPSDDLADGIGLLIRGARRAIEGIDRDAIEGFGQRAKQAFEKIDRETIREVSRRTVDEFDAKKVEAFAEEASREIAGAVDRFATRVEEIVDRAQRRAQDESDLDGTPRARVRVEDPD